MEFSFRWEKRGLPWLSCGWCSVGMWFCFTSEHIRRIFYPTQNHSEHVQNAVRGTHSARAWICYYGCICFWTEHRHCGTSKAPRCVGRWSKGSLPDASVFYPGAGGRGGVSFLSPRPLPSFSPHSCVLLPPFPSPKSGSMISRQLMLHHHPQRRAALRVGPLP